MKIGVAGFFGKIPTAGDFVSRGFSAKLTDALDRMLQAALHSAVTDGASLSALMQKAEPVMVSIRPGSICPTGFWGLWLPSQDRVGRVFPLCIGLETSESAQRCLPLVWPSEQLIRQIFAGASGDLRADDLLNTIPHADSWVSLASEGAPFTDMEDNTIPSVPVDACNFWFEGPESRMSAASKALCSRLPWVSEMVGCTIDQRGRPRSFFAARSLLSWSSLAAVFDERWDHWGWITQPGDGDAT